MQIRTPRRYRGVPRRRIISGRRLLFYVMMLLLIVSGIAVFANRSVIAPVVEEAVLNAIYTLENRAATATGPSPTPTTDYTNSMLVGDSYWDKGALNEALDIYIEIAAFFPNRPELYRRIALGLINQNRPEEALVYAEQAINAGPFSSEAWAIRAWTLDWNGRAGEAISSAVHALELDYENSRARAYLAEAYLSLGNLDQADSVVREALEYDPDSPELYRARGLMKWVGELDRSGANEDFARAYEMAPNMHFIAIDMATIEMGLGNFDTARELLKIVLQADPENELAPVQLYALYQ